VVVVVVRDGGEEIVNLCSASPDPLWLEHQPTAERQLKHQTATSQQP